MILHGIRTLLLAEATITAVLPSQIINRVTVPSIFVDNPIQRAQPPFCVINGITEDPMLTLAEANFGLRTSEVDIDVWAYDEPTGRSAMNTIRTYFDDFSGTAGDYTIKAVLWQDEAYRYVRLDEGRDTRFHVSTTSYLVQYV